MFFVLSGRPVFRNQHGEEELAPGDFVFCPEGRAGLHAFSNPGEEPAQILAISAGGFPDADAYPEQDMRGGDRDPDPKLLARGAATPASSPASRSRDRVIARAIDHQARAEEAERPPRRLGSKQHDDELRFGLLPAWRRHASASCSNGTRPTSISISPRMTCCTKLVYRPWSLARAACAPSRARAGRATCRGRRSTPASPPPADRPRWDDPGMPGARLHGRLGAASF